jgi:hypothetical protein
MWIKSQDRKKLANVNDVWINQNKTSVEIKYTTSFTPTHYTALLGEYKTIERALEILDEIQCNIINTTIMEYDGINYTRDAFKAFVFEMPLE